MALNNLRDLLVDNLRDLYHAEKQLVAALPKMAKGAAAPELREAIESHLGETEGHVDRLAKALESLGVAARAKACKAMEGLIEEGSEILEEDAADAVRDAGIIGAAQKVEHYEMAGYGSAIAYAELLGEDEVADLLRQTLAEEEAADDKLTEIAEGGVNDRAMAAVGEDETAHKKR
jgi:ferritin-like metal-binding protein YciE